MFPIVFVHGKWSINIGYSYCIQVFMSLWPDTWEKQLGGGKMSLGLQFLFVMAERACRAQRLHHRSQEAAENASSRREEATARYVHQAQPPWPTSPICAPSPTSYKLPMMLHNEAIQGVFGWWGKRPPNPSSLLKSLPPGNRFPSYMSPWLALHSRPIPIINMTFSWYGRRIWTRTDPVGTDIWTVGP